MVTDCLHDLAVGIIGDAAVLVALDTLALQHCHLSRSIFLQKTSRFSVIHHLSN